MSTNTGPSPTPVTFTETVEPETEADVVVKHKDTRDQYTLEYTVDHASGTTYWMDYAYTTEADFLDVWFDGRVFSNYSTAKTTHDALQKAGIEPKHAPHERLVTDVDLTDVPVNESLQQLRETLSAAESWATAESPANATAYIRNELQATGAFGRDTHRQLKKNAEQLHREVYTFQTTVTDAQPIINNALETTSTPDLTACTDVLDRVYDQFFAAWGASTNFYNSVSDLDTDDDSELDGVVPSLTDTYRDAFEHAFEYAGHYAVHSKRLAPELTAHQ